MNNINRLLLALSLMLPGVSMANVIVNGTFDNNTTGWIGSYFSQPGGSGGFPSIDTGPYFYAGDGQYNSINQVYNLTISDLASLSSTGLNFEMSADLFGFDFQGDESIFTASFFDGTDATGSLLSSFSLSSATNDPGIWATSFIAGDLPNFQSTANSVPNLTGSVRFMIESIRRQGTSNDGYADNVSFTLTAPASVVPVPAAAWLFGSAMLGLFGFLRRKANV